MRKRMTRGLALMMTAAMVGSMAAGCGAKNEGGQTQTTAKAESSTTAAGAKAPEAGSAPAETEPALEGSLVSAEPKEFTIFLNFNNMPFDSNWQVWQEIAKRTNVSLKGTTSLTNSNEEEAFNLMLSSGQLADIIGYVKSSDLEQLGRDGGLIPLNDLIDQYAPNIKRVMEEDDRFRQAAYSLDGNIYYIPKNQELLSAEYWWIRQDWLDKLGLEVPTTVDELHDVLYAFRNEDPNGNGIKDEVPLFDRAGWKQPEEYLYLWDTSTTFYPRDGKMTFEPLEENFKIGVTNLIKWYEEGILDPEFFTRGASGRDTLLSGDLGGCTHDWVSTGNYNKTLADVIPGFNMVPFTPPADHNGVVKERVSRYPGVGWGISSMCEDPVTVIKFMDFFFSEEGDALVNWGIEGDTYTVNADGTKQFTEKVLNSELTPIGYLRSIGAQYRIGMCQDGEYERAVMTEVALEASKMYDSHPEWFGEDMPPYADGELELKYTEEDDTEYKNLMASIQPYVEQQFQSWILGVEDFETGYDAFVEELKARGIDRALEINQKAYDTYLGKN
ncbi:MAG: extracellular solute-binding protein [Hungatella sp.]|nr:extracellular solute-binding protein [Hungatella sp.]